MKNLSRLAAPALFSLLMATPAMADEDRWYLAGDVGFGNLASTSLTYIDPNSSASASTSFDVSFAGGGTFGYRISDRFSIEGEIKYRRNEFGSVDLGDLGSFSGGDFASLGFGVNLLYRFPISEDGKLSGYIGPGYLYLQEIDIDFDASGQQEVSFESDDGGLQLKLGGRYDVSERWFVEAGATYFTAGSVTMDLPGDTASTLSSDYDHWTVSFGGGIRF